MSLTITACLCSGHVQLYSGGTPSADPTGSLHLANMPVSAQSVPSSTDTSTNTRLVS